MLAEDIAKLMTLIPNEEMKARQDGTDRIEGGAFEAVLTKETPFMYKGGEGINAGVGEIGKSIFYLLIFQIFISVGLCTFLNKISVQIII